MLTVSSDQFLALYYLFIVFFFSGENQPGRVIVICIHFTVPCIDYFIDFASSSCSLAYLLVCAYLRGQSVAVVMNIHNCQRSSIVYSFYWFVQTLFVIYVQRLFNISCLEFSYSEPSSINISA